MKWSEVKWSWRFSCAHRDIMWIVGMAPRILISVLCEYASGALRSGMRSQYPWNRKLGGNHSRSRRFSLLVQAQYWLLCYGSGCCPFWESSYFNRVCFSCVIVFVIFKLTLWSPVVTVCVATCSIRRKHSGSIFYLCVSCGSEDKHLLWSQKDLDFF